MGARGTTSHTRGRWYFEATVLGGDDDASSIGIAGELGDVKAACSVDLAGGTSCSFSTGTGSSGGGAPPPDDGVHARVGDVIGVAVDLDEREIRYTLNGATFGQPFLMVSETSGLPMRPRARMPLEHGFRGEFSMFQHPQEGYLPWQCSP